MRGVRRRINVTPLFPAIAVTGRRGASNVMSVPLPSGRREFKTYTGIPTRLVEPDALEQARAVDDARVRREHAVDVGPDLDCFRLQCRADQGRAVIRSAAAERRR